MIDTVLTHDDIIISSIKPKRQKIKPDSSISQLFYHFRNVTVFKKNLFFVSYFFFSNRERRLFVYFCTKLQIQPGFFLLSKY